MPASKKTLRAQEQKKNRDAGIGDKDGKIPSRTKAEKVMAACTICKQEIRMIKNNEQVRRVL